MIPADAAKKYVLIAIILDCIYFPNCWGKSEDRMDDEFMFSLLSIIRISIIFSRYQFMTLQVEPMNRALKEQNSDSWINGRRRDHGAERAALPVWEGKKVHKSDNLPTFGPSNPAFDFLHSSSVTYFIFSFSPFFSSFVF